MSEYVHYIPEADLILVTDSKFPVFYHKVTIVYYYSICLGEL